MDDLYFTIRQPTMVELKRKRSRFLAETCHADDLESAQENLQRIRKREHGASHHCYAYRVGLPGDTAYKYSDDGEPSGTAGRPIHDVVLGRDVTNVLVVVTRYFGGTKLGTGGLTRAYSDAARMAMDKSGRRENYITDILRVSIEFSLYDLVAKAVGACGAKQIQTDFSDHVELELQVRQSKAEWLKSEIVRLSGGKAQIEKTTTT